MVSRDRRPRRVPRHVRRALDANFNRAREGLRVAEDVARFAWNRRPLVERLKRLRHRLAPLEDRLERVREGRDVGGDVGRRTLAASEGRRTGPLHLFRINLKRAQEALRSLEEFSKLADPSASRAFKRLRYECYRLEEQAPRPARALHSRS